MWEVLKLLCREYNVFNDTHVGGVESIKKYMYLLFSCLMPEVLKVLCTECNNFNGAHVGGVERNKYSQCSLLNK